MGKNLIQQKRGKGSPRYRAPSFRYKGTVGISRFEKGNKISAEINDIFDSQGHSAPLMELKYDDGKTSLLQAPEGIRVGDKIEIGNEAELKSGNVLPLKNIPEGTSIYNIESNPGDGGKFVRSNGAFAKIITKMESGIVAEMPSSKRKSRPS